MDHVSRPLIAVLIGSVAFFAVWTVALKPSSSGGNGSSGSVPYQSAIDKAHQAVANSNAASQAHGGVVGRTHTTTATPAKTTSTTANTTAATATTTPAVAKQPPALAPAKPAATTAVMRAAQVEQALRAHKVIALLFYGSAADDQALKTELAAVPTRGSSVVKLAVPLAELASYTVVTKQVPVAASPTLVLIDGARQATTIVGFADRFEIAQRVNDALAVK